MASLQGWGRQTWNSGAWDTFAPVNATGNGLTSSVGTVSLVTTNVFGSQESKLHLVLVMHLKLLSML